MSTVSEAPEVRSANLVKLVRSDEEYRLEIHWNFSSSVSYFSIEKYEDLIQWYIHDSSETFKNDNFYLPIKIGILNFLVPKLTARQIYEVVEDWFWEYIDSV